LETAEGLLLVSRELLGLLDSLDDDLRNLRPGRPRAVGGESERGESGDRAKANVDVLAVELVEMHGVPFGRFHYRQ
jgi:hypothetical protein